MRKALIGLLMAATAATPLAAQRGDGERRGARQQRSAPASQPEAQAPQGDPEARAERQARRAERQGQRAERQQQVQQPQQAQPPQDVQLAQNRQSRGQRQQGQRQQGQRAAPSQQPTIYGGSPENIRHYQALERQNQQRYGDGRRDRDGQRDRRDDSRRDGDRNGQWNGNRDGRNDGRYGRNDSRRDWSRTWNRGWRNDNRYNWQRYRYSNRNLFRGGRYYAPYRGYNYSRFSIGLLLDQGFYSDNYWISDPWQYRLPPAYDGTRWVRYYDDVLLIDLYTGEVIDAIYDFFW